MAPRFTGLCRAFLTTVCLLSISSTTAYAALQFTPTTTLQAETSPNTSAATPNPATLNGNLSGANVSKLPVRSLLYAGATTKIYAAFQGWFGTPSHINVGYSSTDPAQVQRQVADMMSRGIQGAIVDWFGPNDPTTNGATMLLKQQAEAHPGFEFAIMEDSGALFAAAQQNNCDATTQLISDLNYINSQYESSPAYVHVGGRPIVLFFGVDTWYIDWNRVKASAPGNTLFLFRGRGGFTENDASSGAFQWLDLVNGNPLDPQLAGQTAFYTTAGTFAGSPTLGSAYKGFNDTLAIWSTNRLVDQHCGQTLLDTFSTVDQFYSASNQLPAIQLVTWNDYEEGTAIESGVDSCVVVTPHANANTLTWRAVGNTSAVDHYSVFISLDGQQLMKLADLPVTTTALDLSQYGLAPGNYVLYVEAVGKPSVANKMSAGITYHPGDQSPVAQLAVDRSGGMAVVADASASTDADGQVVGGKIDFGDGTIINSLHGSHTYQSVGQYTVTAKAIDNLGAISVATDTITAKPAAAGVTISTPANGTVLSFPNLFVASANASSAAPISAMAVYLDGNLSYVTTRDYLTTQLKVFTGQHHVTVRAWDASGAMQSSSIFVSGPNRTSPTAVLQIRQMPQLSPLTVLACLANSVVPNGFVLEDTIQFPDGASTHSFSLLHQFEQPGVYAVTGAVIDQFGAGATTQKTVQVPTP
jgi:PKD domain-containing protein